MKTLNTLLLLVGSCAVLTMTSVSHASEIYKLKSVPFGKRANFIDWNKPSDDHYKILPVYNPVVSRSQQKIKLETGYGGGCGWHHFAWKVLEADPQTKFLKTQLLHKSNDTCEAGWVGLREFKIPPIGFFPKKWTIESYDNYQTMVTFED